MTQILNPGDKKEEKLEFLRRGEIETMQKDISRLREEEAQKERERVATLRVEELPRKEEAILLPGKEEEIPTEKETPITLIPKPPKKPSPYQKILARAIVVIIFLFISSFFYWFFAVRKVEVPPEEAKNPPVQELIPEKKEAVISLSIIPVNATSTLEISGQEEVATSIAQLLTEKNEADSLTRILIKDTKENKILGLKEFFQAFQVKTPDGFFDKLDNDFTLFIYSGTQAATKGEEEDLSSSPKETNRLGFVVKVKTKEGLADLLNSWEGTMEKDSEGLFKVLGKEGPALASHFKETNFEETTFRFLTISKADFGICYALSGDYFIFATSFEGMEKAIEKIKSDGLGEKIGQLFIIGFDGKTVTPQLEEIFKKYRPGGVLLLSKNIETAEQLKKLTTDLQSLSLKETGLPLFIAVDQEGGIVSRVKFTTEKTPQSKIDTPAKAYQVGLTREKELKELGINLNLAPVLDVTGEGDFLFGRSFQKDLEETGLLAKYLIKGQGTAGILTAIKHFPGYGGISFNPEGDLAEVETAPEIFQFKKAMETSPEFVMTCNVVYKNLDPNLPFTFSPAAIQFLKNNLGQDVLVISDDLAQNYLLEKFSLKDIILKPIQAGVDVLIFSGWEIDVSKGLDVFFSAFEAGEIPQAKIDERVSKIIQLKQRLII